MLNALGHDTATIYQQRLPRHEGGIGGSQKRNGSRNVTRFSETCEGRGVNHGLATFVRKVNLQPRLHVARGHGVDADVGGQLAGVMSGEVIGDLIATHNDRFTRSYDWCFQTVYKDKDFYMGESDLLSSAFMIDTSF